MKKGYIVSAIIGGTFFAIPYIGVGMGIIPSAVVGVVAFGAGNLIFKDSSKKEINSSYAKENIYDILKQAKEQISELKRISLQIESGDLVNDIKEIINTSNKIIDTLSKKTEKLNQVYNFLNYYLPVTIKILTRYDEIENQRLTSNESKRFMESIEKTIKKIRKAFNEQLTNLYQAEMIDTDAEIKVFESMLKTDGFLDDMK